MHKLYVLSVVFLLISWFSPCLPADVNPDNVAKLDKSTFAAQGENHTLLHIAKPGRCSIQVKSKQGTAVTIVDRMGGPFASNGSAGQKDGRIDLILDAGTYKIRLHSHRNGSGEAVLKVFPFRDVKAAARVEELPFLPNLELVELSMEDLKQQGFRIHIKKRQVRRIEMMGRNLQDARLWRDGAWLEDVQPTISTYETLPGRPMTHIEFHHDLNPGLYLLTCYGGSPHPWTKETNENPFYIRMGIPYIGENGQKLLKVSPFGRDVFYVSGKTNRFQLVRDEKKPAKLALRRWKKTRSRFGSTYRDAEITKKSRDPWCLIQGSAASSKKDKQWVTITAPPGEKLELDFFESRRWHPFRPGRYWISTIHSAEGRDAFDVTGVMTHDGKHVHKADVIQVSPDKPVMRKANLLGTLYIYLHVRSGGTYVIHENPKTGAKGSYQIKPFMVNYPRKYQPPPFQNAGTDFELTAGYHIMSIKAKSKGILHFVLEKKTSWLSRSSVTSFSKETSAEMLKQVQHSRSLIWPDLKLDSLKGYALYLNRQPRVHTGIIVRRLPLDLQNPLPVTLAPGQSVQVRTRHKKDMHLRVMGGKFAVSIDKRAWNGKRTLKSGSRMITIKNTDTKHRVFNLKTERVEPYIPPPAPVIKPLEEIFPILTERTPLFRNFDREERQQFLLRVESPALYRLETTGRMATSMTVRTRTVISMFSAKQNGIGRNALVQQYLKPGDYLVAVRTLGLSRGRAGIVLRRTALDDLGPLADGGIKRCTAPPDAATRHNIHIAQPGQYRLHTYSLGKKLRYRLEDGEGWPLVKPAKTGAVERFFPAGNYFYYSLPEPVDSRRLTFLRHIPGDGEISGKGPHRLELNRTLENTWMEEVKRAPDIYKTNVSASITASLTISGGMEARVLSAGGKEIARTAEGQWKGLLPAGSYTLEAKSPEKNNRLRYSIGIKTKDLIPGLTQYPGKLPADIRVGLDRDSLIDLFSFGNVDIRAELWDLDGRTLIAGSDDMPADWNFRLSRRLNKGQYRLKIFQADNLSGAFEVYLKTREELTLPHRALPFSLEETLGAKVLNIPVTTGAGEDKNEGGGESLLHIESPGAPDLKLALVRDGVLLAETRGRLDIPLPAGRTYSLLAWNEDENPAPVTLKGSVLKPSGYTLNRPDLDITFKPNARLTNAAGMSFRLSSTGGGTLYYSPALERPCLPVTGAPVNTMNRTGWLTGTAARARLRSVRLTSGTRDVSVADLPLVFSLHHKTAEPVLLEILSVNAQVGASVFPEGTLEPGASPFRRSGMFTVPSRTLAGFAGSMTYRGYAWLTAPTAPVTSERKRFETTEQTTIQTILNYTPYKE